MGEILIAFLVIGGLSTLLAILLVIADAYFNDYGECVIKINDDDELKVEGGKHLLATLMKNEIYLPSGCGGRGSCGLCKVKVLDGGGPVLPTETPFLEKEDLDKNIRLACQCKVRNDIKIEIPEDILKVKEFKTTVESIRDLTHDIKEVRLRVEGEKCDYKAGQFVQLYTPPYKNGGDIYRAYSMSSVPSLDSDNSIIELMIRYVPEGNCTTYIHQFLKEDDEVMVNGPYGEFYLRDTDADMICIAGGSGMAPIKSIVFEMAQKNNNRNCKFFFGATNQDNLFLGEEWAEIEKRLPNFQYIPALSNEPEGSGWKGEKGLITHVVDRNIPEDCSDKEAYLCGSPGMLAACIEVLMKHGMKEEKIYYDKFA